MPLFSSKSSTEQSERASGTRLLTATTAALAFAAALVVPANGQAVERVELGVLECTVDGGTGFIFGSTKDLRCTFNPADDMRAAEPYFGVISRFGIDIGSTSQGTIAWAVLAPTTDMWAPGALAGNYVGIGGEATAGVGLGLEHFQRKCVRFRARKMRQNNKLERFE
jgi:hypothetical protein